MAGIELSSIFEPAPGHPVVLLHGNSSGKSVWRHQIPVLQKQGRTILAPDLPGHGESEDAQEPNVAYSFPGYAGIISRLFDRFGWSSVDVVGWSLGGHIGLELLATDRRVRSLFIVGTPPVRPSPEALEQAFYPSEDMRRAGKGEFSDADARAYGEAMMGGTRFLTPELLRNVQRTDPDARRCLFESALRGVGSDQRRSVATIDKPLCVVHGAFEPFVRLEYLRSLSYRALWYKCVHVVRSAGHAPHWQTPRTFNELLTGFLNSVA